MTGVAPTKSGPRERRRPARSAWAGFVLSVAWLAAIASARAQFTVTLLREAASEREWAPRGLLAAKDGKLYGASAGDGSSAVVFSLSLCGDFHPLMTFPKGNRLQHGLSQGNNGLFYGVLYGAESPGLLPRGTLFSVTASGQYRVHHAFGGVDGANPSGPSTVDSSGAVYGVTAYGGAGGDVGAGLGTVYRSDAGAKLTTIFDFGLTDGSQTGIHPASRVVRSADGAIYGTTSLGGPLGGGTIFRLRSDGATYTFELIAAFGGSDVAPGAMPHDLLLARDGNLYGRAFAGQGVIFRVTPRGELSVLHALRGAEGDFGSAPALGLSLPSGSLVEGADGALYGVAYGGGESQQGTLYALTLDGSYSLLHTFSGQREGGHPTSITQASDGRFFGGVESGGNGGRGGIYELTPATFDRSRSSCTPSEFVPAIDAPPPTARPLDGGFVGVVPTPWPDAIRSPLDAGGAPSSTERTALDGASALAEAPHASSAAAAPSREQTAGEDGCAVTPRPHAARARKCELSSLLALCIVSALRVRARRRRRQQTV